MCACGEGSVRGGGGGGKFKCRVLKITPNEDKNISLISFLVPFPVHKSAAP